MQIQLRRRTPPTPASLALPGRKGRARPAVDRRASTAADAADDRSRAARASRFEGEAGAIVEMFVPARWRRRRIAAARRRQRRRSGLRTRRRRADRAAADLGRRAACRRFHRAAGAPAPRRSRASPPARRSAAGAIDIYRTKLPEKQKPTLTTVTLVGAPEGAEAAWARMRGADAGHRADPRAGRRAGQHHLPRELRRARAAAVDGLGLEITVLDEAEMATLGMGALLGVSQGSRRDAAAARAADGTARARATRRSRWSARA